MVKVFLEESAELCMERLDTLIKEKDSYRIVCPSDVFIKKLTAFYPYLISENLRTLSQLWRELGNTPIPVELTNVFSKPNPFRDPTLQLLNDIKMLAESKQALVWDWLEREGFGNWKSIQKSSTNFFKTCIFFGFFDSKLLNELFQYLHPYFEDFFVVKRVLGQRRDIALMQIKGHKVRNIQCERECVRELSKKDVDFIVGHPENWIELFQCRNDMLRLSWIDYQEERTLGYFLSYVYTSVKNKKVRDCCIKNLKNAQRFCSREDLFPLMNWLSLQNEMKDIPFTHLNWPSEASLGDFVRQLNMDDADTRISWNLPKALETCPLKFTRRQFFAYLRKNTKCYEIEHLIPWEDVLYLPINNGCFLHGVSEQPEFDRQRLTWFEEVENRGGSLMVIVPELDEKGAPYTSLVPAIGKAEPVVQKLENLKFPRELIIPTNHLKLSCKNWERFHLSPVRTWLDALVKVKKFDLIQPNIKARIYGEWVHENLAFEIQPKNLDVWQKSIAVKAENRWKTLRVLFETIPIQLQQWHIWTYHLSLRIAQTCVDLLEDSWHLQSECVLPKNSENSGRIDLLATRCDEAVIVDYKTAIDYIFTPGKLNKGYGLQLLLYGRALETHYKNIRLRVVNGNGENLTLDLNEISSKVETIENWLEEVKSTGRYANPPEEKRNTLPLCWR